MQVFNFVPQAASGAQTTRPAASQQSSASPAMNFYTATKPNDVADIELLGAPDINGLTPDSGVFSEQTLEEKLLEEQEKARLEREAAEAKAKEEAKKEAEAAEQRNIRAQAEKLGLSENTSKSEIEEHQARLYTLNKKLHLGLGDQDLSARRVFDAIKGLFQGNPNVNASEVMAESA